MRALCTLFLLPFVTACITFCLGQCSQKYVKRVAFVFSLLPLALLINGGTRWLGGHFDYNWIPSLSVRFHLAIDHLSLIFLYLVNILLPISLLAKDGRIIERPNFFYGLLLIVQGLLIGFFTSCDLVCFTFFFEAILIPLYFLISTWGHSEREKAAYTFIIYMVAGSFLMVAAVLSLFFTTGSFDLTTVAKLAQNAPYAPFVAAVFLLAFLVKTPLFPFHAWLPITYCQAPITATIVLSALLSKAGIYGIIRISMGLYPELFLTWSPYLLLFAVAGVLYGAFAAWGESDFKRLIAYSSFSHVNFVLAGLFVANMLAQSGAILQAVNHAVTITGLFLVAGWLEMRLGSTHFGAVSGLATSLPHLCWLSLFFVLSAVALPGLNNFVSEAMVLYGTFQYDVMLSVLLGLPVIFSVLYMLRWMHSIYFAEPGTAVIERSDIRAKEMLIALPLIALIFWLGLYPAAALKTVQPAASLNTFIEKKP